MAKSRSQIQKEYRQRKKDKGGEEYQKFLERERVRRRQNYIPSSLLSKREQLKRNDKNRIYLRRHRQKVKDNQFAEMVASDNDTSVGESGYESQLAGPSHLDENPVAAPPERLVVKLFPMKKNGPRKRVSRALSKAHRKIVELKKNNVVLTRKYKTVQRQIQRIKRRKEANSPNTPKGKTEKQMENSGLNEEQKRQIRKHLMFGNVITNEIKAAKNSTSIGKLKALHQIVSGKITKKYRCISMMNKNTGLGRNRMGRVTEKTFQLKKKTQFRVAQRFKLLVTEFLERDDNSRCQPGKGDSTKLIDGKKKQNRVLTDYLSNLHHKFLGENTNIQLSLATFCRIRPQYILKTALISRSSCLCTKHQNVALVLKALRREGLLLPLNPESFAKSDIDFKLIQEKTPLNVKFNQWKRIEVTEGEKKKMVTRIVELHNSKEDFLKFFDLQIKEFREHIVRIKAQYNAIRMLKENIAPHDIILHMDFSENYNCKVMEEVQSAYWNKSGVTLHPVVAYHRPEGKDLMHASYVIISDEMGHNTTTVLTFIDELIPLLKQDIEPNINCIHYWTDSPTSQYRNRSIFHLISNHDRMYGCFARWNYFEAGHGKGPCDGLGGTVKRMADEAVGGGRAVIQNAVEFYNWAKNSTIARVKFCFVPTSVCQETAMKLNSASIRAIKGTMKIHAVHGHGNNQISVRDTSCYCDVCVQSGQLCGTWRKETTSNEPVQNVSSQIHPALPSTSGNISTHPSNADINKGTLSKVGDFVAAVYLNDWYIGKVIQIDEEDSEVEVSFMARRKNLYHWPSRCDQIWLSFSKILCQVTEPEPASKTQRFFKLREVDVLKVEGLWEDRRT